MTLLISAVTPDAIIMATDSAVYSPSPVAGKAPLLYSGFRKMFVWAGGRVAVSLYGTFPFYVDGMTFVEWLARWDATRMKRPGAELHDTLSELCRDLDSVVPTDLPTPVGFHLGLWTQPPEYQGIRIPVIFSIERKSGLYMPNPMIGKDTHQSIWEFRTGKSQVYQFEFLCSGASNLKDLLADAHTLHKKIAGVDLPFPSAPYVAQYLRFLIRTVSTLYQVANHPPIVNEPIETLLIHPEPVDAVTFRY